MDNSVSSVSFPISSVLIVFHSNNDAAVRLCGSVSERLMKQGVHCDHFAYQEYSDELPDESSKERNYDLVITLGGDGTVLFAVRILSGRKIPILPINLGTFGFITEILSDEWEDALQAFQKGSIKAFPRLLLSVKHESETGEMHSRVRVMNDVVICSSEISKLIRLSLSVADDLLSKYRADGVIVATPTGSTAYSVAAGGPILHPEMDAIILNPICPFTLSHRPLVLPPNEEIKIVIEQKQRTSLVLNVDGQVFGQLNEGDVITVRRSSEHAYIIRSDKRTFYDVLRSKLNWSGG